LSQTNALPPQDLGKFQTLVDIMARLRHPLAGCPWDLRQTHHSLRPNFLEECYEVLEALDEEDPQKLCQELGDLLMQIVFHMQIAAEAGEFTAEDVLQAINSKLIHRHPHIFGQAQAKDADQVVHRWQALKQEERGDGVSLLDGIPRSLPALASSQTLQHRAAQVGFDWEMAEDIIDKVAEEVREVKEAPTRERQGREFGDLLFALANLGRRLGIDLEGALRQANERFRRRFAYMEELCRQRGLALESLPLPEQDKLWEEAKQNIAD